ncbi:MAG: TatD family hydrolase [Eubacteriales bacterium]|nr:TatD family hydrolase [Eubacteriales bacterium]
MVIDFHTHIFPSKVAAKAVPKLAQVIHLTPSMDGTDAGLTASMEKSQVDLSLVLPVVTDPHQFDSILKFAAYINEAYQSASPRLLSFAGIHPASQDYKEQLRTISREGFRGIKLHPNYQGFVFDDIRYLRLVYAASELGLSILVHTGYDPYTPNEVFCSPDMILHVLEETAPPRLILAHMGNNENYEEAEEKLCGKPVYLDTAYSLMHMPEEQFVRMVHLHGAHRILFGTDAPWTSQEECVKKLRDMPGLSTQEKEQILWQNASILLGVEP